MACMSGSLRCKSGWMGATVALRRKMWQAPTSTRPGARMPSARPPLSRARVVDEAMAPRRRAGPGGPVDAGAGRAPGRRGDVALPPRRRARRRCSTRWSTRCSASCTCRSSAATGAAELRARSVSGRTVLLRHRWAVGLMDSRRTPGPENLRHHDAVLGCLAAQGFSLVAAGTAFALLDAHLYGFMQQEVSLPLRGRGRPRRPGCRAAGPGGARRLPPLHGLRRGPRPAARLLLRQRVRGDPRPGARGARRAAVRGAGHAGIRGGDGAGIRGGDGADRGHRAGAGGRRLPRRLGRGRAGARGAAAASGRRPDDRGARRDRARRRSTCRWSASTSRSGCRTARSGRPTCSRAARCPAGPARCSPR